MSDLARHRQRGNDQSRAGAARPEMRTVRSRRTFGAPPSGAVAERLLDGGDGPPPLSQLLAAATAPATAAELRGETAARASFRSSPHTPVRLDTARRAPVRTTTTVMVAKTLMAIAVTASTASGLALAADLSSTPPQSHLSSAGRADATNEVRPAGIAVPPTTSATGPSVSRSDDAARSERPFGSSTDGEADATGTAHAPQPAEAAPRPPGQCRALANVSTDGHPGKAVDSPAFADLTCSDGAAGTTKTTGRPPASPGDPGQHDGTPDSGQPGSSGGARSSKNDKADGNVKSRSGSDRSEERGVSKNHPDHG